MMLSRTSPPMATARSPDAVTAAAAAPTALLRDRVLVARDEGAAGDAPAHRDAALAHGGDGAVALGVLPQLRELRGELLVRREQLLELELERRPRPRIVRLRRDVGRRLARRLLA